MNANRALFLVSGVAKTLGDALATPRGAAPDRAVRTAALRREHM